MDRQQRFLRRKYLIDNMPVILRESIYHRRNEEEENLPGFKLWSWSQPEGKLDGIF